jgi:hypothetical protein
MRNDARRSIGNEGEEMTRIRDADDPQALALDMEPEQKYYAITGEEIDWLCCTSIDTGVYEPGTPEFELACKVRMKTKADIFSRPLAKAKPGDCPDCPILTGDDAKRFTEYIRSPDHTPEGLALIRQARDLAKAPEHCISSCPCTVTKCPEEQSCHYLKEHDAEVARITMLAVLKDIETYIKDGLNSCDKSEAWDAGYATCGGDVLNCIKNLKSLRIKEPPECSREKRL